MISLSGDNQADVIEAFNSISRYLYTILNLLNNESHYFEGMVNQIYPPGLQFNKANNASGTDEASSLDLYLSISKGLVSSFIYNKLDDFDFDITKISLFGW